MSVRLITFPTASKGEKRKAFLPGSKYREGAFLLTDIFPPTGERSNKSRFLAFCINTYISCLSTKDPRHRLCVADIMRLGCGTGRQLIWGGWSGHRGAWRCASRQPPSVRIRGDRRFVCGGSAASALVPCYFLPLCFITYVCVYFITLISSKDKTREGLHIYILTFRRD